MKQQNEAEVVALVEEFLAHPITRGVLGAQCSLIQRWLAERNWDQLIPAVTAQGRLFVARANAWLYRDVLRMLGAISAR